MFFRRLNWNIVGWFRIVSAISYAVIIAGLVAIGVHWHNTGEPLKLGLSFTGGTDVTAKFDRGVSQAQIAAALSKIGVSGEQINTLSQAGDIPDSRWSIAMQADFGGNPGRIWDALGTVAPVDRSQSAISTVGPTLSREYLAHAAWALIIAITIQFVYIAFRFGWNYIFGVVAVVALVRDSLMMIGIYALAGKEVDDAFLAAVLTVIGYSVMDTIVILDRIRENTKIMESEAYEKIVNTSILQTMSRSVNTLATVVITLVALLALGGASLKNFAFALLVGICSGGYHSIFYSAPLVVSLRKRQLERLQRRRELGLAAPPVTRARTVAEAKAQSRSAIEREAILTARRERKEKEKEKVDARAGQGGPRGRYRKRRVEKTQTVTVEPDIDPLDAQRAGLDREAFELGHEEIRLNLEDEPLVDEPEEKHES